MYGKSQLGKTDFIRTFAKSSQVDNTISEINLFNIRKDGTEYYLIDAVGYSGKTVLTTPTEFSYHL